MKIAILYICTGKYDLFFPTFYQSAEALFFPDVEKHYFVWTDARPKAFKQKNVTVIAQKQIGWPYDTLMRFHFFSSQEERLKDFDYLFFFNANMKFMERVGEEILPSEKENHLVGLLHPGFLHTTGTFETNPDSTAFVQDPALHSYYQGCLSGGRSDAYLQLCKVCKQQIQEDQKKNIIAIWHDESHLNHYFSHKQPKALLPVYGWPEGWPAEKGSIKILQIDKSKFKGGHASLRRKRSLFSRLLN